MTEVTEPMTTEQALAAMRTPVGRADTDGDRVLVSLYPYGTARGGTDWVTRLAPKEARGLAQELLEAANRAEGK
jgi:hypothetical protein